MRAWRFVGAGRPLERQEVEDRAPGAGEVRVAIRAAGLCHSDLHIVDGHFPFPAPLTLGHEGAGVVADVGDGVDDLAPGTRVAVLGGVPCEACDTCRSGHPTVCPNKVHAGLQVDGCFADAWTGPAAAVVAVPDAVGFDEAAVSVDAVLTPYHALRTVGGVRPGERVAVFGLGGLGLHAVQCAVAMGASVVGVDPDPTTHDAALAAGAADVMAGGGSLLSSCDLAVDCAGVETSLVEAQLAVRPGGRTVVVGLGAMQGPLLSVRLAIAETAVLGAFWGTADELREVLDLLASGAVRPVLEAFPLDEVNRHVERLRRGEVVGRVVLHP